MLIRFCYKACKYYCTECRHLIPALNIRAGRAQYKTARPIATKFPEYGCIDDLTAQKATRFIGVLGFFDTLTIAVCTTRHWQASCKLMRESNVCTGRTVSFQTCEFISNIYKSSDFSFTCIANNIVKRVKII